MQNGERPDKFIVFDKGTGRGTSQTITNPRFDTKQQVRYC